MKSQRLFFSLPVLHLPAAWWVGAVFVLFALSLGTSEACVGCRTPGESLGDPQKTIQAGIAFSWSVLFLLAVVFAVLAGLTAWMAKTCREAQTRHQLVPVRSDRPPQPPIPPSHS